jgi:hypothetical protein
MCSVHFSNGKNCEFGWIYPKQQKFYFLRGMFYFPTFQDLMGKVEEALVFFENAAKKVHFLFGFYNKLAPTVR